MKLALCQMRMSADEAENLERGLAALNFYLQEPSRRAKPGLRCASLPTGSRWTHNPKGSCAFCAGSFFGKHEERPVSPGLFSFSPPLYASIHGYYA